MQTVGAPSAAVFVFQKVWKAIMAARPKLHYPNGRGRMESVRWVLAAAGVEVPDGRCLLETMRGTCVSQPRRALPGPVTNTRKARLPSKALSFEMWCS